MKRSNNPLRRLAVAAAIAMSCAGLHRSAAALDILTEDNAPFDYLDNQGHIAGMSTEIVQEIARRAAVPITIQLMPWARAYQTAITLPDNCVYSTARLPERETLFKWVGPISSNKWALFAKSDFNKTLATVEDARNYRIGGVIMDAKVMYLKSIGFANFDLVGDDNLNLAKLLAGRIDLWVSGLYKGRELVTQTGIKNIKPVLVIREVEYYLACHPKTSETTLTALTNALQALQKEGYLKTVTDRYADRVHP
jgi:polar amino acid transport system substrate-binding protein